MAIRNSTTDQEIAVRSFPAASEAARWLSLGAVVGSVLFTLGWLILGFVSPGYTMFGILIAPYSAISQPISGLGLGPTGPLMNSCFVLSGLLLIGGVVGIFHSIPEIGPAARWGCILLLALTPLGMIVDGIFTLESMFPHLMGFAVSSAAPVVGFLVAGLVLRRIPRWRRLSSWLLVASPIALVLMVLFFATFNPEAAGENIGIAGLVERIQILVLLALYAAMGWLAFRRP
jgi:hypothetical protein